MQKKSYENIKLVRLPQSEVEIVGEISAAKMEEYWNDSLKKIASSIEIAGFRKGHIPLEIVVKNVGEMEILETAAEGAVREAYPDILLTHNLDAIGLPHVTITKIARGNPLGFKIRTALSPAVTLPDYKQISLKAMAGEDDLEVSEKEVNQVIDEIRKRKVKQEGKNTEPPPQLTDEFVKSLGKFNDVSDFVSKVKENLVYEKKVRAREKKRLTLVDELIKQTEAELPAVIIEEELRKMITEFRGEIEASGIKFEDYLKEVKKSEEEIKKDWGETALKRAKTQIILNHIARAEKIEPHTDQVEKEVEHILSHYKDADPIRARIYIETVLRNEKTFEFLENVKKEG